MEVKGQLIAPGDISVRERDRKRFELDLYSRKDFDTFIKKKSFLEGAAHRLQRVSLASWSKGLLDGQK